MIAWAFPKCRACGRKYTVQVRGDALWALGQEVARIEQAGGVCCDAAWGDDPVRDFQNSARYQK